MTDILTAELLGFFRAWRDEAPHWCGRL